jgi:hypothetical protein
MGIYSRKNSGYYNTTKPFKSVSVLNILLFIGFKMKRRKRREDAEAVGGPRGIQMKLNGVGELGAFQNEQTGNSINRAS